MRKWKSAPTPHLVTFMYSSNGKDIKLCRVSLLRSTAVTMATGLEGTQCRYVDTNSAHTVHVWLCTREKLRQYDKEIKCLVPEWLIHQTFK